MQRAVGRDGDVVRLQRLVAPRHLVAGDVALELQAPGRVLAHQPQRRLQRNPRAVGIDRDDLEPGFRVRIDRVVGEVGLDADQVAGWADGNVDLAAARMARRIVDLGGDARLDRVRGVGRARHADRDRRVAVAVGVGNVDVLRVGRVGLAGQADAVALERRERIVIPGQADRRLARQARAGRAVQETRRERQRERPAGQQRAGHRAEVDRQTVGHEGVDAEAGGGERVGVGVGAQLDRPGADRGPGGQGDRHADRVIGQPRRRRLQEHLSVGTLDGDPRREIGRAAGVVAQQRHHLHGLAGAVDAAIGPDESVERTRMRGARDAAVGQVERRRPRGRAWRNRRPGRTDGSSSARCCRCRGSAGRQSGRRRRRRWSSRRGCRWSSRAAAARTPGRGVTSL